MRSGGNPCGWLKRKIDGIGSANRRKCDSIDAELEIANSANEIQESVQEDCNAQIEAMAQELRKQISERVNRLQEEVTGNCTRVEIEIALPQFPYNDWQNAKAFVKLEEYFEMRQIPELFKVTLLSR